MATSNQSTVVAVYRDRSDAQAAADELKANGFTSDDIYIGSHSTSGGAGTSTSQPQSTEHHQHHEGGFTGWLKSLFGQDEDDDTSREDQSYYQNAVSGGGVVVSVRVTEQNLDRAADILERHNPVDLSRDAGQGYSAAPVATSSAASAGAATSNAASQAAGRASTTAGRATTAGKDAEDLPKSIPVVQEDLQVGKRAVQRGGVRVYSRTLEQPVEESIRLREEHVRVERQPVNRAATSADLQTGREQVIEVQEYAEEPVVSKQARVVEEVRVSKEADERTETVRDTVRRTEVNVENLSDAGSRGATSGTSSGDYNDDFRRDYQTRYASSGGSYDDYSPAYQYGYTAASDPRYQGRNWDDVESDLRGDYGSRYPNSTWERMKDAVRYGWDRVTGRSKSASSSY